MSGGVLVRMVAEDLPPAPFPGLLVERLGAHHSSPTSPTVRVKRILGRLTGVVAVRFVLNLLWLVLSGFWMFLAYLVLGVLWCITIIGIPLGLANFKLIPISLFPLGKDIVSTESVDAAFANGPVVGPRA